MATTLSGLSARATEPNGSVQARAAKARLGNPALQAFWAHRELICSMNLCLLEEAVAGGRGTGLRAVLDPQPGMCCVALLPKRSRR